MTTTSIDVKGMSCNHCVNAIEKAVGNIDGVSYVEVDLSENQVTVSYDDLRVSIDKLKEAIEDQGYDVV